MPKVHGVSASPFVREVLVAMAEKSLPYENVPVMPMAPPPEFRKISPLGKIPVYQDGDFVLPDSSCILGYLEPLAPDGDAIVGGRFSIADIAIGSQFANWMHAGQSIDAARHPRMAAYVQRLHARPSFKALIEQERKQLGGI